MFKEKRKCTRKAVSIDAGIAVNGDLFEGRIRNISTDGAFIKTGIRLSNGEKISVTYDSPIFGREKRAVRINRVTPGGIAVEFKFPSNGKDLQSS